MTDLNPSEVLADRPAAAHREDTLKTVQDKMPGHISWASDRANFSGCRMLTFTDCDVFGLTDMDRATFLAERNGNLEASAAELMNAYFSKRANMLVVQTLPADMSGSLHVLVTTQLDDEDLEEFMEVNRRVSLEMSEWRQKKAEAKRAEAAKILEERRFAELGRIHEANCGKLKGE